MTAQQSIKDTVTQDMKAAMRARDADTLSTIRMLLAAIKQKEVDERVPVDDTMAVALVDKLIKQRRDSIAAYEQAQRADLAAKEALEITVLQRYLPERLSKDEIYQQVQKLTVALGGCGPEDMGRVMAAAKALLAGKAEMSEVSAAVKAALQKSSSP